MAREDGVRASKEILDILKPLCLNERITSLVFVLSYIYATHENTQPIEDCADEIKGEFIKNFNKMRDSFSVGDKVNHDLKEPQDDSKKDFEKVYDRICGELKSIIDPEPIEPSIKALEAILSYYISLNNPNTFEEEIKIIADNMIKNIRQASSIRKMLMG